MQLAELVRRGQQGDDEAFTALMRHSQRMAFGYAYAILRDSALAEDAVQTAMLEAWRHIGTIRDPDRFDAWIRGIVRYTCLRIQRDRMPNVLPDESLPADPGPETRVEARDAIDRFLAALGTLPERERIVASLYYLQECSQQEVAGFLGLSTSQVNNRLRRVRARLRTEGVFPMEPGQPDRKEIDERGELIAERPGSVDARYAAGTAPTLLSRVPAPAGMPGSAAMALVSQYVSDDVVRLLPLELEAGDAAGALGEGAMLDLVAGIRHDAPLGDRIETGIKGIDLFAPLARNGIAALVGDAHVGKLVLVQELVHRIGRETPLTLLVFLAVPNETDVVNDVERRDHGQLYVMYLPVADSQPEALAGVLAHVDSVITLSRNLAAERIYPAIDGARSRGVGDVPPVVSQARAILAANGDDDRTKAVRAFMAQPFYVAEPFTKRLGVTVTRRSALRDLERLLA